MPFVWGEKYRLGITEIDRQHQTFLLLLNKAYDFYTHTAAKLPTEEVRQRLSKDLAGIRDFAQGHFATEEALMAGHDYPKLAEHRQEHAKLLDIVALFTEKTSRPDSFSPAEWINVMLQWYDYHVQHIDRELGEFLQKTLKG
jgi:hemerythrin